MRKSGLLLLINLFLFTGVAKGQVFYFLPETITHKTAIDNHTVQFLQALQFNDISEAKTHQARIKTIISAESLPLKSALLKWYVAQLALSQNQYAEAFKSACLGLHEIHAASKKESQSFIQEIRLALTIHITDSAIEGFRNSGRKFFHEFNTEKGSSEWCNPGINIEYAPLENKQAKVFLYGELAKFLSKLRAETYSGNSPYFAMMALQSEWYWFNITDRNKQAAKALRIALQKLDDLQPQHAANKDFLNAVRIDFQGKLAVSLDRLNDYQTAQYYRQSNIRIAKSSGFKQKLVNEYFSLAYIYAALGQYPAAKRYYEYSKEIAIKLDRDREYIALNDLNIGQMHRKMGNPQLAWDMHQEIAANIVFEKYKYFESVLQFELLNDAMALGKYAEVKRIGKAILADERPVESQRILTLLVLMESAIILNEQKNAEAYQREIQKKLTKNTNAHRSKYIQFTRLQLEKWLQFSGYSQPAMEALLNQSMGIIQNIAGQANQPKAWIQSTQNFYATLLALLLQQWETAEDKRENGSDKSRHVLAKQMYNILDQAGAMAFQQLKNRLNQNDAHNAPQILGEFWDALLQAEYQLVVASQFSETDDKTAAMAKATKMLDRAREDYLGLSLSEQQRNLESKKLIFDPDVKLPTLPPDEILLRFHISERQSIVFVVYDQGRKISIRELPDKVMIENWVTELPLHQLGELLTKAFVETPLKKLLPLDLLQDERYQRIVWIPDGPLHQLPLAAVNLSSSPNRYSPLGLRAEVVRTHSATDYYQQQNANLYKDALQVALFAAPTFKHKDLSINQNSVDPIEQSFHQWQGALPNLPSSRLEVDSVQNLFKSTNAQVFTAVGDEASNGFLLSEPVRNADILHISTHGYFNSDTPDIVGLATSRVSPSGRDNGFLGLSELLSKPFNNQLVLISGCETMLGEMYDGTGMNGLTHGMLSRGVGATIGTLWKVFDRPTSRFKQIFYQALINKGGDIPKAMQEAQKQMWQSGRFRDPKYWAGFILTSSNQSKNYISIP